MEPEKTCQLIGVCAVLHNIAALRNEPINGLLLDEDQPDVAPYHGQENRKALREYICNTFFYFFFFFQQTDLLSNLVKCEHLKYFGNV